MRASGARRGGPAAVELAQAADAAGFDSIWTIEHVVVPHGYQSRYPYSETGRMGSGLEDLLFSRSRTPGADSQRRSSLLRGVLLPKSRSTSCGCARSQFCCRSQVSEMSQHLSVGVGGFSVCAA